MHKLRYFIVIGVLLVAFALVGTSLAVASQARQEVALADIPKIFKSSYLAGGNLPPAPRSPQTATPVRTTDSAPAYTPSLPDHPVVERQAPDKRQPSSTTGTLLSDFGDWDSSHVYAPTILDEAGTLYMWYSGIDWYNHGSIGLATSTDEITWTKSISNPYLSDPANSLTESSIVKVNSTDYRMYYSNWSDGNVYVALSTDGMNWTPQPDPVFTATHQTGDWDADFVGDPMVYYDGISYYMFYEGGTNDPNLVQIGLAASDDGFVWTRYQVDPVLSPTSGEWDDQWVLDPMVVVEGPDWRMWYRGVGSDGSQAIGYATCSDSVSWVKHPANPVFTGQDGNWDQGGPGSLWILYDGSYQMWYYANRQIGYATSDDGVNWVRPVDDAVLKPTPLLYVEVNYAHDWAHLYTIPNEAVTVTLLDKNGNYKGTINAEANRWGDIWSSDYTWDTGWQDIQEFDQIFFEAAGLAEEVNPIGEIQGAMDLDTDVVAGSLNAPWLDEAQVDCELWVDPWTTIHYGMVDGDGGTFECDFGAEGVDLKAGAQVALVYYEPDGDRVINVVEAPWMRVNYGHDWVGANYPVDHTFVITVTDELGAFKASAEIKTESGRGWGGDGFQTDWWQWTPYQPDIVPGDTAIFQSDDGFHDEVRVGEIQGTLDIEQDLVSGPVYAEWYTDDLYIECHPWGAPPGTPGKNSTAGPDGDPPYTCDWSGEWDIQPGQDVAVMYIQPDTADRVINVFREPAPNMAISKWPEGSGQALPGGPVVFNIYYSDEGEAAAESFTITDTLPASTTYVADSSGVTPTVGDGWVSWRFGPIEKGEWGQFRVVLLNEAGPGTTLENWVEIFNPYDFDDKNDYASAQAYVGEGNYNLSVDKYPAPGDPTPGETFVYNINYGNQDAYASGAVVLTETLPEGTSLVSWYSKNNYNLWKQVSYANGQLVLKAPTLPGYWGDTLRLRLLLDEEVPYDTILTNTVEITTPGDVDPGNDWYQDTKAYVKPPRMDGYLHKDVSWGRLYPGGEIGYYINFSNNGNLAFDAVVTDTLPAGLTYNYAMAWINGNYVPFTPVYSDGQVVVWDVGELLPADWVDVDLYTFIDEDIAPGTTLTNCAELKEPVGETTPYNNAACVPETIQDFGPNLRLHKYYQWNNEGQLQYELKVENIGSEGLDNVWITDTYPLSTTLIKWWQNYGPYITMTENITDRQFIFWADYLNPGENASVSYAMDLDGDIVGQKGLTFTNQATAPIDGDINPDDNTVEVTAFTGADVYIKKWLSGGTALPGEIVTFTVEFGNRNLPPWDGDPNFGSHITETLPAGMTFITATTPWDANQFWTPEYQNGNVLSWGWDTMWANNAWTFQLVVQLAEDLKDGDVLTNSIEAYGDNPEDFDFDWSNNYDTYTITIDIPTVPFFLPMVYKQ